MSDKNPPAAPVRQGLAMPDPLGSNAPRGRGRVSYLLDAIRLRPIGRRALSALSLILFLAGAGMFTYPFVTDIYAEQLIQRPLDDQFNTVELREQYETRTVATGDPLTRIIMPTLGVDALVVEGTSPAALRAGAGHYPNTPLPGEVGNVAIAGHRTTYGRPFNRIDELRLGDEIRLKTPLATHRYRVVGHPADASRPCPTGACWIVAPNDWSVVAPTDSAMLTLTTCHPKGSARERLIIRAELVESVPNDPNGETTTG
jgi:sortase A